MICEENSKTIAPPKGLQIIENWVDEATEHQLLQDICWQQEQGKFILLYLYNKHIIIMYSH